MTRTYELLPDLTPDTPEWHEARRTSLGASEVAAVLGLSKWQTPLDVFRSKMGVPNEIDQDKAFFGHALEEPIAAWVVRRHREEVGFLGSAFSARSIEWPWLSASPDRIASTPGHVGPIPVELKTSSAYARESWRDGIPTYYQAQVQTQIAVLGAPRAWLAVLHDGNSPELYPVDRDEEFIRDVLIPGTRAFWEDYVVAGIAPEPSSSAEAALLWPGNPDVAPVECDEETWQVWADYLRAKRQQRAAEAELDRLALDLQIRLSDATELVHGGETLVTWKPQAGARRLDAAALKRDHPDLAAEYTVQGAPTRRFLPKVPKEVHA